MTKRPTTTINPCFLLEVGSAGKPDKLSLTSMPVTDYYVTSDTMGSVTTILDADGNVLERRSYDAFGDVTCMAPDGTPVAESPTGLDVGFQGQVRDEVTGLYQMGYRWYNPVLGRWLSRDPIGLNGDINQVRFASNSPATFVDANGLCPTEFLDRGYPGKLATSTSTLKWNTTITWSAWYSALEASGSELQKMLEARCPSENEQNTVCLQDGSSQKCTRQDCLAQAADLVRELKNAAKRVIEPQLRKGNEMPAVGNLPLWWNLWGNGQCGGDLVSDMRFGHGLSCHGWRQLMMETVSGTLDKYAQKNRLCFNATGVQRWNEYVVFFHHAWTKLSRLSDKECDVNEGITIDPWQTGGAGFNLHKAETADSSACFAYKAKK